MCINQKACVYGWYMCVYARVPPVILSTKTYTL